VDLDGLIETEKDSFHNGGTIMYVIADEKVLSLNRWATFSPQVVETYHPELALLSTECYSSVVGCSDGLAVAQAAAKQE
jgi:hypothetical protein